MTKVTLIGDRLAEPGTQFVYRGPSSACEGCPYRKQCLNLEVGVRYEVTGIRENAQLLDCAVHDTGVRAVEVEPAPVVANVPSKGAYAGSKASLAGPCPHTQCPSHEYCVPEGADFDDEYRIAEVRGDPPHDFCYLDRDLTLVEFAAESD
ncbi:UPF0179 family protein [Halogeometricum borinquense]|uniref:UPF0179 protein G3I44_11230 n=1 Tax=Halogeometricum borinquense TaxID=60847 RepID=A0A6C0UKE8_9EURY|nr:UPF0179 family protein [Halogeometricum borinquense]QIB74801.1 UPF0179 family protein [Halogeometricum borinquense]QIQ76252.1 UPF0179 family protein [Halogeometricum borinquense]